MQTVSEFRSPVKARSLSLFGLATDPLGAITRAAHENSGAVVSMSFGPVKVYMPTHPRQVAHVLQEHWRRYPKGQGGMWQQIRRLFGDSLVTLDGKEWIADRRLLAPLFSRQNLEAIAGEAIESIGHSLEAMAVRAGEGPLAINREMALTSENVVLRSLFGVSVDDAQAHELRDALMSAFDTAMKRMILFFVPQQIPLPGELAFRRGIRRLDEAMIRLLRQRRAGKGTSRDLLSLLLDTRDEATGEPLVDRRIRDEIVTMFFAGHDSTALTQTWALYLLCRNPQVLSALRAEVDSVLGGRKPTPADVPRLTYTRQVLMEAMRLYPAGWLMPRTAAEDDAIDGYSIPAGAFIAINLYALHRDPALWDRPEVFDPGRFDGSEARWPRGQYIPFGGGPRLCIGDQFALMMTQLTLAMFVQRFDLRLADGREIPARGLGGSLRPAGDVRMMCTPRRRALERP